MLAYLANACNNFKYLDAGSDQDVEGLFEDSLTESEDEDLDAQDNKDEMFAEFDNLMHSNRSAVAIDLRQSVDVLKLMDEGEEN